MATENKQIREATQLFSGMPSGPLASMPLDALRDSRRLTQVKMAQLLNVSQGAVSKVERRTDMFVSTLRNYVRAVGGDLEIRAVFPEGHIVIDQFDDDSAPRPSQMPVGSGRVSPPIPEEN